MDDVASKETNTDFKNSYGYYICKAYCDEDYKCAAFDHKSLNGKNKCKILKGLYGDFKLKEDEVYSCSTKIKRKKDDQCFSKKDNSGCDKDLRCAKPSVDDTEKQKIFDTMGEVCVNMSDCGKTKNLAGHQWVNVECLAT